MTILGTQVCVRVDLRDTDNPRCTCVCVCGATHDTSVRACVWLTHLEGRSGSLRSDGT